MVRTLIFLLLILSSNQTLAQQKNLNDVFGQWHTTHGLDKFPCMNKDEETYFTRLINVAKTEEKKQILAEHRNKVRPSSRMPAAIPTTVTKSNFICPPFRGVRNPHPQVFDFGKASTFERIRLTESNMQIINGLNKNEQWPLNYNSQKGYFEGKTPRGTPTNIIPLTPPPGEKVRFVVQYLIWQDKTPPTLTLCYREDLHKQCNPYAKPGTEAKPNSPAVATPSPASVKTVGG